MSGTKEYAEAKGLAVKRAPLTEQVLVKLDDETYARVEAVAKAAERRDPTHRQMSRAAVVRECVRRGLAEIEREMGA